MKTGPVPGVSRGERTMASGTRVFANHGSMRLLHVINNSTSPRRLFGQSADGTAWMDDMISRCLVSLQRQGLQHQQLPLFGEC